MFYLHAGEFIAYSINTAFIASCLFVFFFQIKGFVHGLFS